jgi:hypothetical protein
MSETIKTKIIELVKRINRNPRRIERGLPPLEFVDTGYRLVFERYLEDFAFLQEGKTLLEMAVFDQDFEDGYYWIPYSDNLPRGFTFHLGRVDPRRVTSMVEISFSSVLRG